MRASGLIREIPVERLIVTEPFLLPRSFDEVTAELLTRILEPSTPRLEVEAAVLSDIDEGSGSRARLTLTYNEVGRSAGLPTTMWLKSSYNMFQDYQQQGGGMVGESIFYRFAPELGLRTPRAYYAGFDQDRQGLLLMEDLKASGASVFSAVTTMSVGQVRDALDQLARLHGRFWQALWTRPGGAPWPFLPNDGPIATLRARWVSSLQELVDQPHLADIIPPKLKADGYFSEAVNCLLEMFSQPPHCLVHSDPHLGNTYLDRYGRVGFIDWQSFRVGAWFQDVPYFMGGAMTSETRRAWQADLLRYYLDQLGAHGGDPPTFEAAWELYVAVQLWGLFSWVVTHVEMQSVSTIRTFVERYTAAIYDLGTLDLLSGT